MYAMRLTSIVTSALTLAVALLAASSAQARERIPTEARQALVERIRLDLGHAGQLQLRKSSISKGLQSSRWISQGNSSRAGRAYVYNAKGMGAIGSGKSSGSYIVVEQQDHATRQVGWEAFPVALHATAGGVSRTRVKTIDRGPAGGRTIEAAIYADGAFGPTKVVGGFHAKNTGEGYGVEGEFVAEKRGLPGKKMTFFLLGTPGAQSATGTAYLYGGRVPLMRQAGAATFVEPTGHPSHPDWNPSVLKVRVNSLPQAQSAR